MVSRILFAFIFLSNFLFSQQEKDSIITDTIKHHSPKKAMLFSVIVPASGQIYNHTWMKKGKGYNNVYWKVPLIYSAIGGTSYFLIQNQSKLHSIKTEYNNRIQDPAFYSTEWQNYGLDDLEIIYKKTLTKRDLSILAVGAIYLIQVIDANIEGHFVSFDISPDLSLNLFPTVINQSTIGMGINLNFH